MKKIILILPFLFVFSACSPTYERFEAHELGLFDTFITFIAYTENRENFNRAADFIFERMHELHMHFDIFNSYEGINNLRDINENAGIAPLSVSYDVINLIIHAREAERITGGAVNAALGPVLSIWREYREPGVANPDVARVPSFDLLAAAAGLTDMDYVITDEAALTVFLAKPDMSLDVGAVAKGFAAGLVMDELMAEHGVRAAILNAGGHIVAAGAPPGRDYWNVGIQNPEAGLAPVDAVNIVDKTVSISGGNQRFFRVGDRAFGHIIDPGTLFPSERFAQVAVIHADSWMADILSTALFILPLEEGKALAGKTGADALWIKPDGERVRFENSPDSRP